MKFDLTQALTAIASNPRTISALSKRDVTGAVAAIGTDTIPGNVDRDRQRSHETRCTHLSVMTRYFGNN